MSIKKKTSPTDGKSSFYGMYQQTRTTLTPDIGIKAPINDLYCPHIVLNQVVPGSSYRRHDEKSCKDEEE